MLGNGYLERWELDAVELDDEGVSEAYFPLWGLTDTDEYLRESDKFRNEQMRLNLEPAPADDCGSAENEGCLGNRSGVPESASASQPSSGVRVAWGLWFWLKRAVVVVLVCLVGSLLVTMAMNPEMTFFDAADLLFGRFANLFGRTNE